MASRTEPAFFVEPPEDRRDGAEQVVAVDAPERGPERKLLQTYALTGPDDSSGSAGSSARSWGSSPGTPTASASDATCASSIAS